MLDEIVRLTKSIKKQMEENLPSINDEIMIVIESRNKKADRIEELLDILLNYGQLGIGKPEFEKLNIYYASFNPINAKFYADCYKEQNED